MDVQGDAHTAKAQTLTDNEGGTNAATVVVLGQAERYHAGICMWLVRNYMRDIEAFCAGDDNRFGRMVVDGGKGLKNANPHDWARLALSNMATPMVVELFGSEVAQYRQRLQELKLA